MQVDADDVVGLEFVRDFAITYPSDHGRQIFGVLHEVFLADRIVEPFTDSNIGELDTAAAGRRGHGKRSGACAIGQAEQLAVSYLNVIMSVRLRVAALGFNGWFARLPLR